MMAGEIIQAVLYVFRQFYRDNVNIDLYYLLAVWAFFSYIARKKKGLIELMKWSALYWGGGVIVWISAVHTFSFTETFLYLIKIEAGLLLFIYVKDNIHRIDLERFLRVTAYILAAMALLALFLRESDLWRHNDLINVYSKTRLQLFYFEPSELSMCCGLLLILCLFLSEGRRSSRKKGVIVSVLMINMILSAGLGGMLSTAIAFIIGTLYKNKKILTHGKIYKNILIGAFFIAVAGILFISSDLPVALRIRAMLASGDGSLYGRFTVPILILRPLLKDTKLLGLGLGNMNSEQGLSLIYDIGVSQGTSAALIAFPNSYLHLIGEAGIIGLIFLIVQVGYLIIKAERSQSALKIALLAFMVTYQIMGGYYTNLLNWVIYGVVASHDHFDRSIVGGRKYEKKTRDTI